MSHLTRHDYAAALGLLARLEQAAGDPEHFTQSALALVADFVASDQARVARGEPAAHDGSVASMPLAAEGSQQLRIELHRSRSHFSPRDRARLDLLAPHLAFLYRAAHAPDTPASVEPRLGTWPIREQSDKGLTPREREVMRWLAFGKTDADIAALLAISPRTVHKHLEHIYEKLGVETRTAAVMALRRSQAGAGEVSRVSP